MKWLGNVRFPPETIKDLSDKEWLNQLLERYGARTIFEQRVSNQTVIGKGDTGNGHAVPF